MITMVGTVCVFVADQDRAKAFYTEKLGLELRADAPLFPGAENRWLAVAPAGAQTEIILYKVDENWQHYAGTVGKSQALTLTADDIHQTYADLKAKSVTFHGEPEAEPWGTFVTLHDSEGNSLLLVGAA